MQRSGLLLLALGVLAVAFAYASILWHLADALAPWALALGTSAVLAGIACLGAARRGRATPRLAIAITVAFVAVAAGLGAGLLLPEPTRDGPLLLGLPRTTTILLLLAGALPLVLLPVAFALAFDDEVVSAQDVARIGQGGERDA